VPADWWATMPWFGMMMGPIMFIVFLVIVILVVVPLIRWMGFGPPWWHGQHTLPPSRTALDILNERYARGEIDKIEYEEKRRVISQG
jgi:putative membrane protein